MKLVLGCVLLLAACDSAPPPAPNDAVPVPAAAAGGGGGGGGGGVFKFVNFQLGAVPGTVCPGPAGCTNGAAEPAIRADAAGNFYVGSELGVGSGTLAWTSTDGGLHYTALTSPNQYVAGVGRRRPWRR